MPSEVSMPGAAHDREPTVEKLKQELAEARNQQAATSDILRIISDSANGAQPVFDAIVASCQQLLRGAAAAITQLVGRAKRRLLGTERQAPGSLLVADGCCGVARRLGPCRRRRSCRGEEMVRSGWKVTGNRDPLAGQSC